GDEAVAAVVALPADDRDRPAGPQRGHLARARGAGTLHELHAGHAALLDRPAVDVAHLLRRVERLHPARERHRTTATAPAIVREWVSETSISASSAESAPCSATLGPSTTSMSCQDHACSRSALATASLAQKRAARCCPGRARPRAYSSSRAVNSRSARRGRRASARSRRSISSRSIP